MFPFGTDTYMIQLLETPKFLLPKDSSQLSTVNISIHISHNAQKVVVTNHILFYHGEDSSHMTRFFSSTVNITNELVKKHILHYKNKWMLKDTKIYFLQNHKHITSKAMQVYDPTEKIRYQNPPWKHVLVT